jgi:hypothetical protein
MVDEIHSRLSIRKNNSNYFSPKGTNPTPFALSRLTNEIHKQRKETEYENQQLCQRFH